MVRQLESTVEPLHHLKQITIRSDKVRLQRSSINQTVRGSGGVSLTAALERGEAQHQAGGTSEDMF